MSFALDGSYSRPADGAVIIAGSPLRLFRLSSVGRSVAEAMERGEPLPAGHHGLTDRLLDAGAIHPRPAAEQLPAQFTAADVTVVVPAFGRLPEFDSRLAIADSSSCRGGNWWEADGTFDGAAVLVVDDGSDPPLSCADQRVRIMRLDHNSGPAAARNAGLAQVRTALVAFVDTDVCMPANWLDPLLAHFSDPRVALVAPRVLSAAGGSPLVDQFEEVHGSLDLGGSPARIAPGTRVSYVPGAAVLCRTEVLLAVGGFDETLRVGEDVDLVWRLDAKSWRCRYEPAVEVFHRARPGVYQWARQRFGYGTSAAPLAARHRGALAPLRISGWSAGVWTLAVLRRPLAAAVVAAGTTVALQRKLRGVPPAAAARLAVSGHLYAGEQIAATLTRVWWPITMVAACLSRRARPVVLAAAMVPAVHEWLRLRPRPGVVRYITMSLADDIAYGAGVWRGCVRKRSATALIPDLTGWPSRRRVNERRSEPKVAPTAG
ncbi:MAG: mycofactocin biosynthesis glycosyltransferase MftF [Ilumatobacteraceae bacterium]